MARYFQAPPARARSATIDGPGSNGFWKRNIFATPGTYTWTAEMDGKVKIQAIGTGAGGQNAVPGSSGAYGEKVLTVLRGQTLTIVVGAGSAGTTAAAAAAGQGGTTSISGTPVGGTALSLIGASGGTTPGTNNAAGTASGPWDTSFAGARAASTPNVGSPSSGSPFGSGNLSIGSGGAGWNQVTHNSSNGGDSVGLLRLRLALNAGASFDFWDLANAENKGGISFGTALEVISGIGAGGGYGASVPGGVSLLGGGSATSQGNGPGRPGGPGAGGGAGRSADQPGGKGGDGIVLVFWDEGL